MPDRAVTYSLSASLDGYIVGPDGGFTWSAPDEELFVFATDEVRGLAVHLLGRRLYETMVYWEDDDDTWGELEHAFAALWRALPKVVFSTTLTEVRGNTRLATADLPGEIERLRAEQGPGNIGIGGATLAAQAADLDLIDEYRVRLHPVLVGGGTPYFSRGGRRADLDLLDVRQFSSGVLHLWHRVRR